MVAEFIDQARSGARTATRREYQNLLAAARRHAFERVRVESVDRGHRNDMERRAFEAELAALGIDVVYNGEPEKQAPQYRKLQRCIKGVLAEWESDGASQRTYKRHRYRAQQGKWRGGMIPYGLQPDGHGWFTPDPDTSPVLRWILEQRANSRGHHAIAEALNTGIDLGHGAIIPPPPSLLAYRRKPYIERQDPETGDIIHLPRPMPATTWHKQAIVHICHQAVAGVYAGILNWGQHHNRFAEDADGNPKELITVDTGRPLVPRDVLDRVRVVEQTPSTGPQRMSTFNTFLLSLRCGFCGEAMHGYTSTKCKPNGRTYTYRKYRCAGRANNPGACQMPILSADALEQAVIAAVFTEAVERDGTRLHDAITAAVERQRAVVLEALHIVEAQLPRLAQQRDHAVGAVLDPTLPAGVKAAIVARAERMVAAYEAAELQQLQLRAALDAVTAKARSVVAILTDPNLDPGRWQEPAVFAILRRALTLLVHQAVVRAANTRSAFAVHLTVTTDPIAEPQTEAVVKLANPSARVSDYSRLIITKTIMVKKYYSGSNF